MVKMSCTQASGLDWANGAASIATNMTSDKCDGAPEKRTYVGSGIFLSEKLK